MLRTVVMNDCKQTISTLSTKHSLISSNASFSTAATYSARQIYFNLLNAPYNETTRATSYSFLTDQLKLAKTLPCDFPNTIPEIEPWLQANNEKIGTAYRMYLVDRKNGKGCRYFSNKSHALYFLKSIAPTKLVDGAWLYGLLKYWNDERFAPLISIYLDELGEGDPDKNHVHLYQKLLRKNSCERWKNLSDFHYIQGAIQLALAYHAEQFLPELLGFNLGYEQLALHLLITAYELNELCIDPYYFTLHVTIDNIATGHAKKSLEGLIALLPHNVRDREEFFRRVKSGYALNSLGTSIESIVDAFNIDEEMINVLAMQAEVGKNMHSDYCRIHGKTINQWLEEPSQLSHLLICLQENGWIKRHEPPANSRFWRLIEGKHAEMFGVFDSYQKQVIYDWIAGDSPSDKSEKIGISADNTFAMNRQRTFRMLQRLTEKQDSAPPSIKNKTVKEMLRVYANKNALESTEDANHDVLTLEEKIATLNCKQDIIEHLVTFMSPSMHHTPAGFMATRIFAQLFN
ncbi:MAG: iron-containing redox enzyme family protein [Pseudomonadota bacterium]